MNPPTDAPIQTDVVDEEEVAVEVAAPEKTTRESIMDSIVANRTEELEADLETDVPEDEDLSVETEVDAQAIEDLESPTVKVKIDGVETEVTPEEIREYQVNKAADIRMREANAEAERLANVEADLKRREDALKVPPADTKDLAKRLVKSTFDP